MALSAGKPSQLMAQAWKGVLDIEDPYSVPPTLLARARNIYLPDPANGCSAYARPGFTNVTTGAPLGDGAVSRVGQGMAVATLADGRRLNFVVAGGHLYRSASFGWFWADVTPAGVTIDPSARVHLTPFSNRLVVNDGVNPPWVASDLEASPITATLIDYTGDGKAWVALGPAVIYGGAIFFIVRQRYEGVLLEERTSRIGWSEPDDPFTGYRQTDFDNEWDVVQNGDAPIYALWGTNAALVYFRDEAIGYISGTFPDLRTTATHDAVDEAIGTRAPATIVPFGNSTYFADLQGRPQRLTTASGLTAIHEQLRRVVDGAPTSAIEATARAACAVLVPELQAVLMAVWSPDPGQADAQFPTTLYAFHAPTGRYLGEWKIGAVGAPVAIHALGLLVGSDGEMVVGALGTPVGAADVQTPLDGGALWVMARLGDLAWTDGNDLPDISVTTPPLGYAPDLMLNIDRAVAVVSERQPGTVDGVIVQTAPGEFAIVRAGVPGASFVDDGTGGYVVTDADLTGTGRVAIKGDVGDAGVIY